MLYRIHRIFLQFLDRPVFQKTRRFGNSICFRPQVKVGEKTPAQLGPLERARSSFRNVIFLEYRTMEKIQKNSMNSLYFVYLTMQQINCNSIYKIQVLRKVL
jgi:hypothetical protein